MSLTWHDVRDLGLEGKGWCDTAHFYDRLPARAEGIVTEAVWSLSRQSVGLSSAFVTDATEIHARAILRLPPAPQHQYVKWLDLYVEDAAGEWRWGGFTSQGWMPSGQSPLLQNLPPGNRRYKLYLPYFYSVERLEIGINEGATLRALPARPTEEAIAYYGTSIVHGHCVSRPGMLHASILGRRLDAPVINLGFSGNARMEPPLGELIAELRPAMFAIDPLPNMGPQLVAENAEPFMRKLLEKHPETPIVMIEDRTHANHWLFPQAMEERHRKRALYREVFDKLVAEGFTNLRYVEGEGLIGTDSEATTDSSHPSDLGAWRYADVLEPVFRECLGK